MLNAGWRASAIALTATLLLAILGPLGIVNAAALTTVSVTPSDSRPDASGVSYDIQASGVTQSDIKCIRVEFDTAVDGSGGKPSGLNISSAALSASSDYVPTPASWSISNNNTTGVSSITFATGESPASSSGRNVILTGITNGSTPDTSYYVIFNTYNNTDCASTGVDNATAAFIYTAGQSVSLSVDSSLSFTVAGKSSGSSCNGATTNFTTTSSTVPMGTPTTSTNRIGAQDLTVSTNGAGGYTVYTRYTGLPTSGSNNIDDHSGSNASPTAFSAAGTEAFGYTTSDSSLGTGTANRFTSTPNVWAAFTTSNAEVAYHNGAVANQTTCVGVQAGISATTQAGSYNTTLVYTAVPVF